MAKAFADLPDERMAVVGDVGRTAVRLGLTDVSGGLQTDTIRTYDAISHTTISGALMSFREDVGLQTLPRRCALAVAGVPRGDTISITNSRWFISKSGLEAMLQRAPIIINDFAANAWALSAAETRHLETVSGKLISPATSPGTFCVIGVGTGLGVAALNRDETGRVTVLPTEAGHSELVANDADLLPIVEIIRRQAGSVNAETILSASGLVAIYNAITQQQGSSLRAAVPEDVTRGVANADPTARKAVDLFCKALWSFAGNLTLVYGSWDGIFLSGRLLQVLRPTLRSPPVQARFTIAGPYERLLRTVPSAFMTLDHGELRGAAEALRQVG